MRVDGKDNLIQTRLDGSLEMRSLPPPPSSPPASSPSHGKVPIESDSLDLALQKQLQFHPPATSSCNKKEPLDPSTTLKKHRQHLEEELLHVTRKLNRKYAKKLFPKSFSPSKMEFLASQWKNEKHLREEEKYQLYMDGRYATQSQIDFYERPFEKREEDNHKHRTNTMHTKYGDALVKHKKSLRGKF